MLEKIEQIHELLNIPNVDADTETAITNMKILNLLVGLRAEAKQLILSDVINRRELLFAFIKDWKEEFKDENWMYLDFMAERFLSK